MLRVGKPHYHSSCADRRDKKGRPWSQLTQEDDKITFNPHVIRELIVH